MDVRFGEALGLPEALEPSAAHHDALQEQAQSELASLTDHDSLRDASVLMMALALHLERSLGTEPAPLVNHWIATARAHGARE